MHVDYLKVVQVLSEEVAYAMAMPCVREDSEGNYKEYRINGISYHILRRNNLTHSFCNSFLESVDVDCDTTMMVRVYLANGNKAVRTDFCYSDIPMNPEGLKIFLHKLIHSVVSTGVQGFFLAKNKDSCYSHMSEDPAEVYLEEVASFNAMPMDWKVLRTVSDLTRDIYLLDRTLNARAVLDKSQTISIVVDSAGRRIIEAKDGLSLSLDTNYLNCQKFSLNIPTAHYFTSEKDFFKQFPAARKSYLQRLESFKEISFVDAGLYPVIFDCRATHTLFHEALVAHLFSGDYIVNNQSTYFKNRLNTDLTDLSDNYQILKQLTISVDPTKTKAFGSYKFDQEGVRAEKVVLCDRGMLNSYLLTRNSAARLDQLSNGHARAESYVDATDVFDLGMIRPEARISHLVIKSHQGLEYRELVEAAERFITNGKRRFDFYLEISSNSGFVDIETGSFTMNVNYCRKVYFDGRPAETINGGTLSGTPHDFLANIKAVGKKNQYDAGYCGAASGWVPTSSEAPPMFLMAHYVPEARPEETRTFDLERDKYVPKNFD